MGVPAFKTAGASTARRTVVAGALGLGVLLAGAGSASAQVPTVCYENLNGVQTQVPCVASTGVSQDVNPTGTVNKPAESDAVRGSVLGSTQARPAGQARGTLPVTGGDVLAMAGFGVALVVGGAVIVTTGRSRRTGDRTILSGS